MKPRLSASPQAFSLIEVVIALAITAFCLIILLAILPVSLTTIKNASEETAGINVISTIVSDLKSTPATTNVSPNYQIALPTTISGANQQVIYIDQAGALLAGANTSSARYKVTLTMSSPTLQNTINGVARASWPAQAAAPTDTVEASFALNRN
jgi:uncharacterized protein (TIGR02598 family)